MEQSRILFGGMTPVPPQKNSLPSPKFEPSIILTKHKPTAKAHATLEDVVWEYEDGKGLQRRGPLFSLVGHWGEQRGPRPSELMPNMLKLYMLERRVGVAVGSGVGLQIGMGENSMNVDSERDWEKAMIQIADWAITFDISTIPLITISLMASKNYERIEITDSDTSSPSGMHGLELQDTEMADSNDVHTTGDAIQVLNPEPRDTDDLEIWKDWGETCKFFRHNGCESRANVPIPTIAVLISPCDAILVFRAIKTSANATEQPRERKCLSMRLQIVKAAVIASCWAAHDRCRRENHLWASESEIEKTEQDCGIQCLCRPGSMTKKVCQTGLRAPNVIVLLGNRDHTEFMGYCQGTLPLGEREPPRPVPPVESSRMAMTIFSQGELRYPEGEIISPKRCTSSMLILKPIKASNGAVLTRQDLAHCRLHWHAAQFPQHGDSSSDINLATEKTIICINWEGFDREAFRDAFLGSVTVIQAQTLSKISINVRPLLIASSVYISGMHEGAKYDPDLLRELVKDITVSRGDGTCRWTMVEHDELGGAADQMMLD